MKSKVVLSYFILIFTVNLKIEGASFNYNEFKSLDSLINIFKNKDYNRSIKYGIDLLYLAKNSENNEHIGYAYHKLGFLYAKLGDHGQAIYNYLKAIDYKNKYSDNEGIGECYSGIGASFFKSEDYEKAILYLNKSISFLKTYPSNFYFHDSYYFLSKIYRHKKRYDISAKYLLLSINLVKRSNNFKQLALENTHLGALYREMKLYDSALICDNRSLKLGIKINDTITIARAFNNIGFTHHLMGNYVLALNYFDSSIVFKVKEELGNTYLSIADTYIMLENPIEAEKALKFAQLASPLNLKDLANTTKNLAELFYKGKNYNSSHRYLLLLNSIKDSISFNEKTHYHNTYQSKYAQSGEEKFYAEREKDFFDVVNKMQRKELNVVVILLAVILIFSFILLMRYIKNYRTSKEIQTDLNKATKYFREVLDRRKSGNAY